MEVDENSSSRVKVRKSMDDANKLIHDDSSNAKKMIDSIEYDNDSENKDEVPPMD